MRGIATELLDGLLRAIATTSFSIRNHPPGDSNVTELNHVTEFWNQASELHSYSDRPVSISGQLSTFAPALPGVPSRKRHFHRRVRRTWPDIVKRLQQQGHPSGPTTLDAFLAFSAGQMVIRMPSDDVPYVYLGLYHSIVRNSIPLYVRQKYFVEALAPYFAEASVFEARVIGFLKRSDEIKHRFLEFLRKFKLDEVFPQEEIDEVLPGYIVQVDGDDDLSRIERVGAGRYLDGDIWVALKSRNVDRVVTRFLDLADPSDLMRERDDLIEDVKNLYGDRTTIISQYDQIAPLFSHQLLSAHEKIDIERHSNRCGCDSSDAAHFDVFLSHNSSDKPAVRELKRALNSAQIESWLDEDELQPGIPWQALLEKGITNSNSVAVLIGKDGIGPWEDEEMRAALSHAIRARRPVIPVLLPGAPSSPNLPPFLSNRTWVDLRGGIEADSLAGLVWGITGRRAAK